MDQDNSSNIASTADAPQMHIFARLPGMTGGFQVLTRYADAVVDMARYAMLESGTSSILAVLIPNLEADEFQEAVRNSGAPIQHVDLASIIIRAMRGESQQQTQAAEIRRDLSNKTNTEPWTTDDSFASDVTTCRHCHNAGHTVIDCIWADSVSGNINACPLCNMKHRVDECPDFDDLTITQKYELFVVNRGNMPPIAADVSWLQILGEYRREVGDAFSPPRFFPWTREFTCEWVRTLDDASRTAARRFYDTANREVLPVDPLTASLQVIDQRYSTIGL